MGCPFSAEKMSNKFLTNTKKSFKLVKIIVKLHSELGDTSGQHLFILEVIQNGPKNKPFHAIGDTQATRYQLSKTPTSSFINRKNNQIDHHRRSNFYLKLPSRISRYFVHLPGKTSRF